MELTFNVDHVKEIGLNRGVVYRLSNRQWYPLHRKSAVSNWLPYTTTEHELPVYVHFTTKDAAIAYLKTN